MMPKAVHTLPKVAIEQPKKEQHPKFPKKLAAFSITVPLINGKASSHSTVAVPTDSKTFQFDIDTKVAVKTTPSTWKLASSSFLTYLLAFVMVVLAILFWLVTNTLSQQIHVLKNRVEQMNQEISLISENNLAHKLLLEQISQRFDASRKEQRRLKCLVERETQTTLSSDSKDYFSDTVTDSDETVAMEDDVMEGASVNTLEKYEQEDFGVISETSTESSDDMFFGADRSNDREEARFTESQRSPRNKRSEGRGKQASQQRKQSLRGSNIKNNKSNTRKANRISAVHFKGSFPETVIRDGGSIIAPWFWDVNATGPFGLSQFNLSRGKGAVQVSNAGLYYIYAQVYYLTNETFNSFSINLRKNDTSIHPLAYCSVSASFQVTSSFTDVSCFTSVVRYLKIGDQILLQQRERHRLILMKEGQTFLGLVRLEHEKGYFKI